MRANARNTAISSVHGERRSSSRSSAAFLVKPGRSGEHLVGVAGGLDCRVDALDQQAVRRGLGERVGEVRGRVGRGQRDFVAAVDERDGDRCRERRLSDPAFAHRHQHAVAGGLELVDELIESREVDGCGISLVGDRGGASAGQPAQSREPGHVSGDQLDSGGW